MANEIRLRLSSPHRIIKDAMFAKVIIPGYVGDMMILPDRAPSEVLLRNGVLQILDKNNQVLERYFIKGGIADVAKDVCAVLTDKILDVKGVKLDDVRAKIKEVEMPEYKEFYQMIITYLEANKN